MGRQSVIHPCHGSFAYVASHYGRDNLSLSPRRLYKFPVMLSCHLAYFIALPDALVSRVPLIPLCMPLWQGTCSAQLFIVIGLSGCSISIIKEQATDSLALVPVPPCNASPSDYLRQMFRGNVSKLLWGWKGRHFRVVKCKSGNLQTICYTIFSMGSIEFSNAEVHRAEPSFIKKAFLSLQFKIIKAGYQTSIIF